VWSPRWRSDSARTAERRAPSIRIVAVAAGAALTILTLAVIVALIWTASLPGFRRDVSSEVATVELELALLTYHRLSNRLLEEPDAAVRREREALREVLRALLVKAEELAGSDAEERLLDGVAERLAAYFAVRERSQAERLSAEARLNAAGVALEEALASMDALRELNDRQVRRAELRLGELSRVANIVGAIAAAALFLGLLALVVGAQRYVLRPLLELHESVMRLRSGDADARTPARGVREIAELTRTFNAMADAMARQQRARLAVLGGIAHDLRNPLAGMKLGLEALQRGRLGKSELRIRGRLERQVDQLARMIDDLLDATRIEAGSLELRRDEIDLREVIDDVVHHYAPTSPEHGITTRVSDGPVLVWGDAMRLGQVVGNLLSNAIKFTPAGKAIDITLAREGDEAIVTVADQGVGIPADEQAQIFLPFRRGGSAATPGVGLGLSIVRRIVVAHGGTIEVDSTPGEGSVFRIRLPRVEDLDDRSQVDGERTTPAD
jgi:two-component system, OmpR family, sensor histidine kinase MtrB